MKFHKNKHWIGLLFLSNFIISHFAMAAADSTVFVKEKFVGAALKENKKPVKGADPELKALKELQVSKKGHECREKAEAVFKKQTKLKPWIFSTWSECLGREMHDKAPSSLVMNQYWTTFVTNRGEFQASPAGRMIFSQTEKNLETYINQIEKSQTKETGIWIDRYFQLADEKESRAKALAWSGNLALTLHDLTAAENFYLQSLQIIENKVARDKLGTVRLALNKSDTDTNEKLDNKETLSDAEQKYEDRFKDSVKNSDFLYMFEMGVEYLNQFPNGKRAKWAFDKLEEIYSSVADKAVDEKYLATQDKLLSLMAKLDAGRVLDIVRWLHRRSDYSSSLRLGKTILPIYKTSAQSELLLFILGRSAELSGRYKDAIEYFESYLRLNSAGEEVGEVQLRLALSHIRLKEYSSAIAALERLLNSRAGEKVELLARYWLVRSLAVAEPGRAADEQTKLITKYPFSYYGLRLKGESNHNSLDPLPPSNEQLISSLNVDWTMTHFQKETWDRVLLLGASQWYAEALAELKEMTLGTGPALKVQLAKALFTVKLYNPAIRLINEALDQAPQMQVFEILNLGLPMGYEDLVREQSVRNGLSPWLVFSLIRQESGFNERATSVSQAMGLMQLIPPTASEVAQELGLQGLELPNDAYVPAVNIQMGTSYLAKMIRQFGGNVPLGLAAYNAGPQKMQNFVKSREEVTAQMSKLSSDPFEEIWMDELPWQETSFYVKAILRNSLLYRLRSGEKTQLPPVLWSDLRLVQQAGQ